jgi:uncharacterized protein (TIGR00255 family)
MAGMKIQSMTGYGKGETAGFRVEVRSINHKNIDIQINAPDYLYSHEPDIKKEVKSRFARGRFDLYVFRQEGEKRTITLNRVLAREYYDVLMSLRDELALSDAISLSMIASQRDIFTKEQPEVALPELSDALTGALSELEDSRLREGEHLAADISGRIETLRDILNLIKERRSEFIKGAKKRLHERLKEYLENMPVDETRLIQETAILVERSDITEEIVRTEGHLESIAEVLAGGGTVGKKIDFYIQELRREVNTIGAKASEVDIIRNCVDMKNEIEKIKEQVQNIQ